VIVVDTSVWIDVLGGRRTRQARRCGLEGLGDFALAASLYRTARREGVTIRNTLDCLIAAPCVRTGAPLLHSDADCDRLASCSSLRIFT
jgi:predicted nucleic acid-binding protein